MDVDEDKDEVDVVDCNGIGGTAVDDDDDRVCVEREGGDVGGDGWRV